MIVVVAILLIGIAIRWSAVREGIGRGFEWFDRDRQTETEK